ncbi:MAG: hypothetical protein JWO56_2341 [Acidobacteria bacterium]|nr:hypothetical protein [Acidobacteriota bacterium]
MTRAPTFGLAVTLFALTPLHAADRMQPGKWQFSMTSGGQTRSSSMCITPERAASANGDTKSARAAAQRQSPNCVIKAYNVSGDTVSYAMECGGTLLECNMTYHGDDYVGTLKATDQGQTHTTALKGHRLGSCEGK